jgi:dolichyl-phosphate beta-glucosyltransferase
MSSAPPRERPALSIVLPVYNEELVLERTFSELVPFLERLAGVRGDFEVVCVDDGSRDASPAILARAAAADARVRVLALPENRGKGAAVRVGVLTARGDAVLFMDADLSTPLAELPAFLAALAGGADVAIGDRRAAGSEIRRRQPWLRQTLGKGFTLLTQLLLVRGVHDFTCGFKAFRGATAHEIFRRSTLDGWAFDAELVVIAAAQKKRLAQLPVVWRHEDDSKVRLGRAVLGSLRDLGVIWWRRLLGRYR